MKERKALVEELATMETGVIDAIIGNNPNAAEESLTTKEKFAVLVFREQAEAINGEGRTLVLDANYAKSKFHNKTDKELAKGQCNQWLVDYYRLIDGEGNSLIQVYTHLNPKTGDVAFDLCTSCAAVNRMQFEMEEELGFEIQRRPDGTARTSRKNGVGYGDLPEVLLKTMAVLAEGDRQRAQAKADKQKAKDEAKAQKKEERAKAKAEKAKAEPEVTVEPEEPKKKAAAKRKRPAKKTAKTVA